MKDLFKGYIKKTEEEIEKLWNSAVFVFDTNVLLNLYRYSEDTRNSILDLIKNFQDRIILPYQAAFEFSKNRHEVIADQEKIFDDFSKKLKNLEKEIESNLQHPFLSEELNAEIKKVFEKIEIEVTNNRATFNGLSKSDPIFNEICSVFQNKISRKYSDEELESLYKDGEKRYSKKIPPGFEDALKSENKFGDFILWQQIIDIAKKEPEKGIILISDEKKSDWWWYLKNKQTVGPRPELVNEIFERANSEFHIFSSDRFLALGNKYSNVKPSPQAIDEIEAIKKDEIKTIHYDNNSKFEHYEIKFNTNIQDHLNKEFEEYRKLVHLLNDEKKRLHFINNEIDEETNLLYSQNSSKLKKEISQKINMLEDLRIDQVSQIKELNAEIHHLRKKLNSERLE